MGKNFVRETNKGQNPPDVLLRAVREVKLHNKTVRSNAKDFQINYQTLARYWSEISPSEVAGDGIYPSLPVGYIKYHLVFNEEQESQLAEYIITADTDIYFGFSPVEFCKLAYTYAVHNNVPVCSKWE